MATSGPITVTKSSHDADILLRMMGRIPRVISGHAEPLYYAERNAPQGSAERCSDCQAPCFYDAAEFYQLDIANDLPQALSLTHDPQEIQAALRQGRFGRCIYRCDNNVPDSLVVVYHYPDARVRFEMEGHSPRETRITKITGTKGILEADMLAGWITINGAVRNNWKIVDPHCYGDQALISRFLHNLEHGTWDQKRLDETLVSHALAFASQRAIEKGMISFPSYLESQGAKLFLHNTSYI